MTAFRVALASLLALACSACAPETADARTITVFAASSLTGTFTELAEEFESDHPGTRVILNASGSSTLATQIVNGAPADVFASASMSTMRQVIDAGAASESTVFARNTLAVAVPPDNPAAISELGDLIEPGTTVAVCRSSVPCGALAEQVLAASGLALRPVTYESDVKAVLTKVRLGEVDAGLVYVTDVLEAGNDVVGIDIPDGQNAATDYPIATLTASADPETARQFVDFVLSEVGRDVLADAGFESP